MPSNIPPLIVPATADKLGETLSTLRDYVARVGHLAGLSQRAIYNLKLAVDEIATNIIHYAYDDTQHDDITIVVTASITRDKLTIILEDTGNVYDPRNQGRQIDIDKPLDTREFGGLGIYLALKSVDKFHYEYMDGCNRNCFTMNRSVTVQTTSKPVSILLYESHNGARSALIDKLKHDGYSVETCNSREDIYRGLLRDNYDILIIGSSVTHHDTFWLLKRLMLTPDIKETPTLVIAENTDFVLHCLELGAKDYMLEPVNMRLLSMRIETIINNSSVTLRGRITKLSQHIKNILLSDDPDIRFGRNMNFDRYLEKFLIEVQGIYNADAGTLYMRTENDSLRFAIVRTNSLKLTLGGMSNNEIDFPTIPLYDRETGEANHHNVASHVALSGRSINIADIYENEEFDFSGTRWFDKRNHYRSVTTLTVPLKDHTDKVIGVVQLINAQDETGNIVAFDTTHQMIVEALCAHTAVIVNNFRLLKKQDHLIKLENDLKIGRRIQRDFMPKEVPQITGWQIGARFFPAREVAGDFYDFFANDNTLIAVIADVCDKGVGAALFMALTRSLLRAFISQARENVLAMSPRSRTRDVIATQLKRVIYNTNDYILAHHYDLNMFTTLFIAMLIEDSGRMLYINAGHTPAPVLLRHKTKTLESLRPTGPAMGMFEDAAYEVGVTEMKTGDALFAYTDGLSDIKNQRGETLGDAEILHLLESEWQDADDIMAQVEDKLFNHMGDSPQFDDMTFWLVKRNP
ncbi:MAG: SpoIIE family protein phosphatase [Anaerolineae bacterium]|nr:SpoIIE family protein phosphatase [Anaerolineae bacterium]